MATSPRFDRTDWLTLLGSLLAGAGFGFLLLLLLLRTLLEPELVAESVLRINRSTQLVEEVLRRIPLESLPEGVIVRRSLPPQERLGGYLSDFDREVMHQLAIRQGKPRELRRDLPPMEDPWGGYWIRLEVAKGPGGALWLYQPERLSSLSVWYLPIVRTLALVAGMVVGLIFFLRIRVERPFLRVTQAIPDTEMPPLALLPEQGIAPLRQLTLRVNRLLERLNAVARDRRMLLRGLAHDFGGPQARLMLQAERLRGQLKDQQLAIVDAMIEELRQLASITQQLGVLADATPMEQVYEPIALDDFCSRLVASYPGDERISLDLPRLFLWLDLVGFERSLCNLIDNALEYGRPPVWISAHRQGAQLKIQVDDHGDGLRSPTLPTMPNRYRADDRQRTRHSGLGLQLVDRFCRHQGGRLVLGPSPCGGLRAQMLLLPTPANPLYTTP
jgi:two-component system osmolarity sensor histidine kinase EnvZ